MSGAMLGDVLTAILSPPTAAVLVALALALLRCPRSAVRQGAYRGWFLAGGINTAGSLAARDLAGAAISAAHFAFGLWMWWRGRPRDRRNVLGAAGYKARAVLAELARKTREAATPRPVLRPVPGGAR